MSPRRLSLVFTGSSLPATLLIDRAGFLSAVLRKVSAQPALSPGVGARVAPPCPRIARRPPAGPGGPLSDPPAVPTSAPESPPPARRGRGLALAILILGLAGLSYLLAWPVRLEPVAWTPPPHSPPPLNSALAAVERIGVGLGKGPEDVEVDGQGRIYVGLEDGKILRYATPGAAPEELADTKGRPLGLGFAPDGLLWIADADKGLLSLDPETGALVVHSTEAEGLPYGFTDDLDVSREGTIYFSDASSKFGVVDYKLDLLEHGLNGRLLAYDPKTQQVRVLLGELQFANGVAVSADQRFVLVVETGKYRVTRYWLAGPQQGQHDVFTDALPGFPDGISARPGGGFWIAIASPRDPLLDACAPHPWTRKVIARLPAAVQPAPKRHAWVIGVDAEGAITHDLQHLASDSFSPVTSVQEHGQHLYLGSLSFDGFARLPLPPLPGPGPTAGPK